MRAQKEDLKVWVTSTLHRRRIYASLLCLNLVMEKYSASGEILKLTTERFRTAVNACQNF